MPVLNITFVEGVEGQAKINLDSETTHNEAIEQAAVLYEANSMIEKIEVRFGDNLIEIIGGD